MDTRRASGVEMRLVLEDKELAAGTPKPDPALVKAIVRVHQWFNDLLSGRAGSMTAIARSEGLGPRYVHNLLPLAFLAGIQPPELTAETLTKRSDLPLDWAEQKAVLGFR